MKLTSRCRKGFSLLFVLIFSLTVRGQEISNHSASNCIASPLPVTIDNGGQKLSIIGKGTRLLHWAETIDGEVLLKNELGHFEYVEEKDGTFQLSGVIAANVQTTLKSNSLAVPRQQSYLKLSTSNLQRWITYLEASFLKDNSSRNEKAVQKVSEVEESMMPNQGDVNVLCLLIEYPDLPKKISREDFDGLFNTDNFNGNSSFNQFYRATSIGKLNLKVDVKGWYTSNSGYEAYGEDMGPRAAKRLVQEAIFAADEDVDYSKYDNDGDGYVDGLIIIHAGPGAESGSQTAYIWSHQSSIGDIELDGVKVSPYCINPEVNYTMEEQIGIGVLAHEFGHVLGLPDLYDTGYDSEGIGMWGLMASGSWLGAGDRPANLSAWCRVELGWIIPKEIGVADSEQNISLSVASSNVPEIYKINTPESSSEYFLLENRQQLGNDTELRGHGLAIWHIDESVTSDNNDKNHKLVDLEEADGLNQLDEQTSDGDTGDLYPGTSENTLFDNGSNPNSKLYSGNFSGVTISDITETDNTITCRVGVVKVQMSISGDLAFGRVPPGSEVEASFTITNKKEADLEISSITCPEGFSVDWNSGTIAQAGQLTVMVRFTPSEEKKYDGNITITPVEGEAAVLGVTGEGFTDDNYESNNEKAQAFDLSNSQNQWLSEIDGLGRQGDEDWYKIQIPEICRVIIDCHFIHENGNIDIELYTPDFRRVLSDTEDDNEQINYLLNVSGDYYIRVFSEENIGNTYDLKWDTPEFSLSGNLAFGQINGGNMGSKYFTISNNRGEALEITSIDCPQDFSVDWSGGSIDALSSQDVVVNFIPTIPKEYKGEITVTTSEGKTKSIEVSGTGFFEDRYEENNDRFHSYDLVEQRGKWLSEIEGKGRLNDADYYHIVVNGYGQTLGVNCTFSHAEGNVDIALLNDQGQVLSSSESEDDNESLSLKINTSAVYYIVVYGDFQGQAYDLKWNTPLVKLTESITFGEVPVGTSAEGSFTIANITNQDLVISSVDYPVGYSGSWNGGTLVSGATNIVTVTFSPQEAIAYEGDIVVYVEGDSDNRNAIPVTGKGVSSDISLSGDLSFGEVPVNQTAQKVFSISNTGEVILNVSGIEYPEGYSGDWNEGNLNPGEKQDVTVTFLPTAVQNYTGEIQVRSNAGGGVNSIGVSGAGIGASLTLTGNLDFGKLDVNQTAEASFIIQNDGGLALNVTGIEYPEGFTGDWNGGNLQPGEGQEVKVTFAPQWGGSYEGVITVSFDDTKTSAMAVRGFGVTRIVELWGDLSFGNVEVGTQGTMVFSIRNQGNEDLNVTDLDYSEGFSGDWTGGTIAAGQSMDVNVSFVPSRDGGYEGAITVHSDATSGNNTIAVFGNGTINKTRMIVLSGDLEFGKMNLNAIGSKVLTISNKGEQDLSVSGIEYPEGFTGDWNKGTIAPGTSQDVNITFTPAREGTYEGLITILSDATSGTNTISVSGEGVRSTDLISLSGSLSFGNQDVNTTSSLVLTISNWGEVDLNVSAIEYPEGFTGDWTGGVVAQGASQDVNVTYAPTEGRSYSGEITVLSDATSGTNTIAVSGTGISRNITLSGELSFGNVDLNSISTAEVTIENKGNEDLTVSVLDFPEGFQGDWQNGTIAAGTSRCLNVSFHPVEMKDYSSVITIHSDATDGPVTIAVAGSGLNVFSGEFFSVLVLSETCPGLDDGVITVSSSKTDMEVTVEPGAMTQSLTAGSSVSFNELSKGEYTLEVSTSGSQRIFTAYVTEPEAIEMSGSAVPSGLELLISGGVPPYTITMGDASYTSSDGILSIGDLGAGDYSVLVTDQNSCSMDAQQTFTVVGGLQCFPNPVSNGTLNVLVPGGTGEDRFTITIKDLSGRTQLVKSISQTRQIVPVAVGHLAADIYILQLEGKNGYHATQKIVVQ